MDDAPPWMWDSPYWFTAAVLTIVVIVIFILFSATEAHGGELTTSCPDCIESVELSGETTGFVEIDPKTWGGDITLSIPDCFSFSDITPSPLRIWFPHQRSVKMMLEASGTALMTWDSNPDKFGLWDQDFDDCLTWDGPQRFKPVSADALVPSTYVFPSGYHRQIKNGTVAIVFEHPAKKPMSVEVIYRKKKTVVIVKGE